MAELTRKTMEEYDSSSSMSVMDDDEARQGERYHHEARHPRGRGLEFGAVSGWEEGVFPSQRNQRGLASLEEERRLAYVAITRARRTRRR